MSRKTLLPMLLLPLLVACSDLRGAFFIDCSQNSFRLIRVKYFFWKKTAAYSVVAARMPECMRRHDIGSGSANTRIEVYAPGNDAWILKQGKRMVVVETRTCQGFARLDEEPADGMGPLQGSFQMRGGSLTFVAAAKGDADAVAPAPN